MVRKAAQSTPNQLLRQARLERGWTQKDVADRIGAPLDLNVTRWERGTARPSAYYVQRLCELFGKSPGELGLLPEHPQRQGAATREQQDPRSAPELQRLWNVPFRRNPFFTGRIELLQELHHQLQKERRSALNQTPALTGLGGIGKTQLAVEYAYRYAEEYRAVFWTRAASRETLAADYVGLAQLLGLPVRDARDQPLIVEAAKRWLVQHEGWLLILDNADDLPLVVDFLPVEGQGHILLTTRAQATGPIAKNILVEQMESSEGTRLLLRRAKLLDLDAPLDAIPAETVAQAQAIVKVLDGLPLALDQAGAFIEETECSLSDYLALYERQRSALLKRPGLVSSYPYTVASTWSLSFQEVKQANPLATEILHFCAFLDADAIPEEILSGGMAVSHSPLRPVTADPLSLNEAIQVLRHFSLVKRDREKKLLSVHRLVQAVLRDALSEAERRVWAERAMRAVNAALPGVEYDTWAQCERLLPQALAAAQGIEQYQLTSEEAGRLLFQTAFYLHERARYAEAEPLYRRALRLYEQQLGPEHPRVALSLYHLAELYRDLGKYAQAEPLYQRALCIREQALGPEHPLVAETLNDLAILYREQGKYTEAELLFQRTLRIREQQLGPEHPQMARPLGGLAILYREQGKYTEAELLSQRALRIREQQLGPEHPDVAHHLNGLANLYRKQGKYAEAEPLSQRALRIREQQLGPEHPDVGYPLNDLADLYREQGRYAEAELFYQRVLRLWEQAYRAEHPHLAHPLYNLAELYREQGRYAEAEPLYQCALRVREQQLGPEHPHMASPLNGLASLYREQGRYAEAEPLYQRALSIRTQALGHEHPDTAETMHDLAQLREVQGNGEEARVWYTRALAMRERALGTQHPRTRETRSRLIVLLHALGRHEQAAQLEIAQVES